MRTFDLSPLFRSTVGFDHLANLMDAASHLDEQHLSYPPYNIEKLSEDDYRVTMAVAGFSEKDIEITSQDRTLLIIGRTSKEESAPQYLHRGIAGRSFERRFDLAEHIKVVGARLVNGLLHVELHREVPEAMKPRTIAIATSTEERPEPKVIENMAA